MILREYEGVSVQGRRSNNEDAYLCKQLGPDFLCLAVADGMGGASYGELASKLVIEVLEHYLSSVAMGNGQPDLKRLLSKCYEHIQSQFSEYILENPDRTGMGTTLSVLLIYEDRYAWGNIGDSRIYRLDSRGMDQLTVDHTYLEKIREEGGEITDDILANYSHLLTKSISGGSEKPDIFPVDSDYEVLNGYTGFLLCSDGLITDKGDELLKESFATGVRNADSAADSANKLVQDAFVKGSSDNITAVVARIGDWPKRKKVVPLGLILQTIIIILGVIIAAYWFSQRFGDWREESKQSKRAMEEKVTELDSLGGWVLFKSEEFLLRNEAVYIEWQPFPYGELLKQYQVTLFDVDFNELEVTLLKKDVIILQLNSLFDIDTTLTYHLRVDALLKDKNTIQGDTLRIVPAGKNYLN